MRKNATKIAAMVLSLALTVTSVNVPTTSSAAAKVKLNKTKATLTVGKTTKLVAKVNGKKVKATFTSSNAKVAKVAKTTGKVTAKKAGTAKITAKYNGKKAVCKVTVKAKATPTVAPTAEPTVEPTVAPTAEPTVEPTVEPTMEPTMAPVVNKEAANIEMTLVNPFDAAHIDTVLIGTNAELRVKVTDEDGKPVVGESVVITNKKISGSSAFVNKSQTVETTNEKGYATFVYGTYDAELDSTDSDYVTNLELTASVAGTSVKTTSNLKFAGITFSKLDVLNENDEWDAYPNPIPSTNKVEAPVWADKVATVSRTMAADQKLYVEYVNSNQVSASDADHSITLNSGAYLVMPGVENKNTASEIVVPVNFSSGSYGVYTDGGATYFEKVIEAADASELQYATVNFDSINLSAHTRMEVNAFVVKHPNDPMGDVNGDVYWGWNRGFAYQIDLDTTSDSMTKIYKGKMDVTNKSLQIPLNNKKGYYLFVTAKIISKGQVDTDNNKGFVLRDIVGVYNKTAYNNKKVNEPISGVTINWAKNENAMYEVPTALDGSDSWTKNVYDKLNGTYNEGITDNTKKYTFKYSVPAFPFTGNAVITVYDANKKAVAYWAKPTTNEPKSEYVTDSEGNHLTHTTHRNVNIFANAGIADLYQITEAEAKNINVGTVTTDADGNAKVDSTATGVTHVIGTITSTNPNVVLDASNSKLYSSVQWNPIPNATTTVVRKAGAALVGQTITINAQLTDRNGNPVKTSGVGVKFEIDDDTIEDGEVLGEDKKYNGDSYVEVISCDTVTDATGKAKLVLTAANAATLIGLSAKVTDKGSAYTLAYTLGAETVAASYVDLYWVDANLEFIYDSDWSRHDVTSAEKPYVDATMVEVEKDTYKSMITPDAGTNWEYGVNSIGDRKVASVYDVLHDYAGVSFVNGLVINTTVGDDSKGTVTNAANGKANATSKQAGMTYLINTLDSTSVTKDVTFTFFKPDWSGSVTLPNIGEGTPNLDKKLTLNVNWDAAETTLSIIIPTGTKGEANTSKDVYVKVVDAFGNPIAQEVTLTANGNEYTGTTDSETGVKMFTIDGLDVGKSTTVVAKVNGVENLVASKSIKWVELNDTTLDIESAEYDYDTKTVTVKFTDYIEKSSVVKQMFSVKYDGVGQIIGDVKVSGKTVTLALPGLANVEMIPDFEVAVAESDPAKTNGITYKLAATDGEVVSTLSKTITFK